MAIQSLNPATGEILKQFEELTDEEVRQKIELAAKVFETWKKTSFAERAKLLKKLAVDLRAEKTNLGRLITLEMGRPITPAMAEIEKCAWACEYYAQEGERLLQPEIIPTEAEESGVRFDPLGVVLAVMPWNFPFWQVIRFAAPAVMAGNVALLKHASNVPQCALALEELFVSAGFPVGVFQTLLIAGARVESVVTDPRVAAATLTGSEYAGTQLGAACGREIKPVVLELGGSDPFIVLSDADVELAAQTAVLARFQNAGQSCIAAKRFIVVQEVAEQFIDRLTAAVKTLKVGDPGLPETEMGPLCSAQAVEEMEQVIEQAQKLGAQVVFGGQHRPGAGFFFEPTVLTQVTKNMFVWNQEVFGPILPVMVVKNETEAIQMANDSRFGLAASVWTKDMAQARQLILQLEVGAVFVNSMVKSDPRLPFGGTKKSGLGRELGEYGIKSFTNAKTFLINL